MGRNKGYAIFMLLFLSGVLLSVLLITAGIAMKAKSSMSSYLRIVQIGEATSQGLRTKI